MSAMLRILGFIMVAAPFVGLFAISWHLMSFMEAGGIFGATMFVVSLIGGGLILMGRP